MTFPAVGVQFRPDGEEVLAGAIRDLVDNLSRAQKAQDGLTRSQQAQFKSTNDLLGGVTRLAQAYGALRLGEYVNDALEAAEATTKLAQATGSTVEGLSVLSYAAKKANVDQDQFAAGTRLFAKTLNDLRNGVPTAVAAFKAFNLTQKDFVGLKTDQALLKVADAQARYADSAGKSAAAGALFGTRAGAQLIPLLNELANGGFARTREEAEKLGIVLDEQSAQQVQRYNDALQQLKALGQGVALQLGEQLAPTLADSAKLLVNQGSEGLSQLQVIGKGIAIAFRLAVSVVLGAVEAVRELVGLVAIAAATTLGILQGLLSKDPAQILNAIKGGWSALKDEIGRGEDARGGLHDFLFGNPEDQAAAQQDALNAVLHVQNQVMVARKDFHAKSLAELKAMSVAELDAYKASLEKRLQLDVQYAKDAEAAGTARADARQKALENALKLTEQTIKGQEAAAKAAYDQGTTSLTAYFAERRRLIVAAAQAEATAIAQERAVVAGQHPTTAAGRSAQTAALGALDTRGQQASTSEAQALAALGAEQIAAQRQLEQQRVSFEQKLLEARGQRAQADQAAIAQEAESYRQLLVKLGDADATRKAQVFADVLQERAAITQLQQDTTSFLDGLERQQRQIAALVQAGAITPDEGRRRTLTAERQQLPNLQALQGKLQSAIQSTSDPAQQKALQDQLDKLNELVLVLNQSTLSYQQLGLAGTEALEGSLETGLTDVMQQTETFGEVWTNAGRAALRAIESVIARLAALAIQQQLVNLLGLGASVVTGGASTAGSAITGGGGGNFAASGGLIRGPGTDTSDSVPFRLSNFEYVLNARSVRSVAKQYGLGFLHRLNALGAAAIQPTLPRGIRRTHFATGGLVGSAVGAGAPAGLQAEIGLEEGLVVRHLESRAGERAIIRVVTSNLRGILRARPS